MKTDEKIFSKIFASTVLILVLILASPTISAFTIQNSSANGSYAYITDSLDGTVSVINTTTDTVTATVKVGEIEAPIGITVDPAGKKVYVANMGSDNVSVIDTTTNTVIDTVNVGKSPYGAAVTPDGKKVYVTNWGSNNVSVIDTASNRVTATVDIFGNPERVAVNPDGRTVYVTNYESNTVSVIDIATNIVTATISLEWRPEGVAVSPDGKKLYVTDLEDYFSGENFLVIDTATNTVTSAMRVKNDYEEYKFGRIAPTPDGKKVYVVNWNKHNNGTVCVIDTITNNITATIPVGWWPEGIAITPDGKKVYVANQGSNNVSVIDTATNTIRATVKVGDCPKEIAIIQAQKQPIFPKANFSSNVTSGYSPFSVQFTDLSENATGWIWEFGDGANSTEKGPEHTYSKAGNYSLTLTVSNEYGTDSKKCKIKVQDAPQRIPGEFNLLIFVIIALYLFRKSI